MGGKGSEIDSFNCSSKFIYYYMHVLKIPSIFKWTLSVYEIHLLEVH